MNAVVCDLRAKLFELLRRLGGGKAALVCSALLVAINTASPSPELSATGRSAPSSFAQTGLYEDPASPRIGARHLEFSPQYPLWTDGTTKQRWISLPAGAAIDGSDPENWKFPVGTRLWKEFTFNGTRVEKRYMQLQQSGDGLFAAYAWSPDGHSADLVRTGRHQAQGRQILPPMPWEYIGKRTDDELKAIFAYLKQVPPIRNKAPDPIPPAK